ncbi:hypothetical protein V9N52_004187 [Vibrio navarrensis]
MKLNILNNWLGLSASTLFVSANAIAYDFTVNNHSSYEIQIYNGMLGFLESVKPNSTSVVTLSDGEQYQIQYIGSNLYPMDYLGAISRDGFSGFISLSYQQPADTTITWWSRELMIGTQTYADTEIKHWPEVTEIPGCGNESWGSICSAQANELSVTISNE